MPQVPAVSRSPVTRPRADLKVRPYDEVGAAPAADLDRATQTFFLEDGGLARGIAGYEPRDGQRQMASAVAAIVENGGVLLAEAGTGTGKTLAYLIPTILSRQRVLVSTGTKNLQEQVFFKDLPAIRQALALPFTATLMKGRSNYLCLHRWELYRDGIEGGTAVPGRSSGRGPAPATARLIESGDHVLLPMLREWVKTTTTGDRAELRDVPEDLPLWKDIAADADTCLGSTCPRHGECFVTLMRQRAAESDVVIVNHHLLCADAALRHSAYGEVIPSSPTLVIDEAHQIEEVATQYFGLAVSTYGVEDLLRDVERLMTRPGETSGEGQRQLTALAQAVAIARDRARGFFAGVAMGSGASESTRTETRVRYDAAGLSDQTQDGLLLAGALEAIEGILASGGPGRITATLDGDEAVLQHRAGGIGADLRRLLRADDPDFVYYIEARGRGLFLRAAPVDVSRIVREALLERFRSVVLTSATLAIDGSFDYVRGRLGIRTADTLQVSSEFDYARQALLYLPRHMPSPKSPGFAEAAAREIIELLKRSRGRAFVLFTSYGVLRIVQRFVEMSLTYPILVQGTAPRSVLIEEFRATPNAVLLATASFWQGVDVVGEALSCVIIDKLPFASPADPVTAARIAAIAGAGGDAFAEYQVPLAILNLQQGLGRLIRHRTDRGVLAVLDPRLKTMGYGRRFLASLPPAPVTYDLDAVERFFG